VRLPYPNRAWQKPTGAQFEILPNLKTHLFQPTVPTIPLPPLQNIKKQLMAIVTGLTKKEADKWMSLFCTVDYKWVSV